MPNVLTEIGLDTQAQIKLRQITLENSCWMACEYLQLSDKANLPPEEYAAIYTKEIVKSIKRKRRAYQLERLGDFIAFVVVVLGVALLLG